jgi:hypothetical protein
MVSEHAVIVPPWIAALVDVVVSAMTPLGFIGRLGYRWWEPENENNDRDCWQVYVFPTTAVCKGGPNDGLEFTSGFTLDVSKLTDAVNHISEMAWHAPCQYTNDLDGPEFRIQGQFAGKEVRLRVFTLPPGDEPVSCSVDYSTGEVEERPG